MNLKSHPIYLHTPAHSSNAVQVSIEAFLKDWLKIHELNTDKKLFHYTNLDGLKGILNTRSLWFTHAGTLNDPMEIHYGRDLIVKLLNDYSQKETDAIVQRFFDQIIVMLTTLGSSIHHPFICCFCEEGDLLSQWRAYADMGGGYSIGFNYDSNTFLSTDISNPECKKPLFLRKVIYKKDEQEKLVLEYLNLIVPIVKKEIKLYMDTPSDPYPASVIGVQACNVLLDLALCFKHSAFQEEKEWRLLRVTRDNFDTENLIFRGNSKNLVPYRSLFLFNENEIIEFPASSIIFGPSVPSNNKIAIELYVQHLASSEHLVKIVPHKIHLQNAGYSLR